MKTAYLRIIRGIKREIPCESMRFLPKSSYPVKQMPAAPMVCMPNWPIMHPMWASLGKNPMLKHLI